MRQYDMKRKQELHELVTKAHDATASAKAIVQAAKVHGAYTILPKCRGAHDAGLHRDVQVSLVQY